MVGIMFPFDQKFHEGDVSDHFDGSTFHNIQSTGDRRIGKLIKWLTTRSPIPWPEGIIPADPYQVETPKGQEIIITFVNHASALLQIDGYTIITDPQYANRASPVTWAGPKRVSAPGIPYEQLPKIDAVLISHNHYDHMDVETLQKLKRDHDPVFIVGIGNEIYMKRFGLEKIVGLDWWQSQTEGGAEMMFVPAQHFSGRGIFDRNKALWGGFVVKAHGKTIFFGGDTGYSPHFKDIHDKVGDLDFSLIPIGAYCPRAFMKPMHLNPNDAVLAHIDLKSKLSVGIHFKTFQLTDEGFEDPVIDLETAKKINNVTDEAFIAPKFGQKFRLNF